MRFHTAVSVALAVVVTASSPSAWADVRPHAGMMRYPDVSQTHIVFSYSNDLWLAPREGGTAVPLASPPGQEFHPRFGPDGQTIAFMGNYDGNLDLYTIPVNGGVPVRVTHHPAGETLCDWIPDGKLLFFTSGMGPYRRISQLFSVSSEGGLPGQLPVPYGARGAVSPDGRWLAYTPHNRDAATWKRYRGGMASDIWLFNLEDHTSKKITDWEGTDSFPMWHNDTLYYVSDAGPEHRLNIWAYDVDGGGHLQITHFEDYDVKWPAIGPGPAGKGEIVFQNGPELYLLDLATNKARAVEVFIPGDRPKLRPQATDAKEFIFDWDISATGKRAVLEARGDIWTVPAKKGSPRNLTRTAGVAERNPSWSPDKRWIAYFSDATGEYELYITQSDGKGETRQLTEDGKVFRYNPVWSPNSEHIAFSDYSGAMYLHTIDGGETRMIDQDPLARILRPRWSHDSNWITYTKTCDNQQPAIWLYNLETDEKHQVTTGFFSDYSPTFDRKGDHLYYASARSLGSPIYEDMGGSYVYAGTGTLIAVPLNADVEYPWAPESDEETWDDEEEEDDDEGDDEEGEDEEDGDDEGDGEEGEDEEDEEEDESDQEAEDDGVTGVWEGTIKGDEPFPPEGFDLTITIRLSEDSVSGTVSAGPYTGTITDGSFDRETGGLNFSLEVDTGEGTETFNVTATIAGESMTGSVTGTDFNATFTASRTSTDVPEEEEEEEEEEAAEKVEIDIEGFEQRGLQLPVGRGRYGNMAVNDKNQLIYASYGVSGSGKSAEIKLFDLDDEKKEEKTVVSGTGSFAISADGKKLLVRSGKSYAIVDAKAGQKLDKKIPLSGMRKTVDPREEWQQLFTDAWRIQREFFYAPNMHGVDWEAVRGQYAKMLDDCASREDVSYVISEMISELNVGHAYYMSGSTDRGPSVSVGMLGCDFELHDGAYRIKKIYHGAPWDSDARGPLSQPGVDVKEGDYLLAVNNLPLDTSEDPWAAFQGLAGRTVTLTVSSKPTLDYDDQGDEQKTDETVDASEEPDAVADEESDAGANKRTDAETDQEADTEAGEEDGEEVDEEAAKEPREILVELMGSEGDLRFRAWIEQNRAYVEEKTEGKIGYIYVPDTAFDGQREMIRQFYGQRDKAALIVDERWNSGGFSPARMIEMLNRPVTNYWVRRHGRPNPAPGDSHQGPKCMLINGMAGSGGDAFPYYFRKAGIGKLIGTRTWGGLVGISGNPRLIDGAYVSAPTFAFFETDGTWGVEGHGVDPDIEVIDDPAEMVDGGDPQLDAAIQHLRAEIERNPYVPPSRPEYPDRSGMGIREEDK
jgi:tricorn protease-like protein/C-terminal processing protease CtpA/Prc